MNLNEKNSINIFINMYVHYVETFNAYTISNRFNNYFLEHKTLFSLDNPECYVKINSAPHCEEELIKIEIKLSPKDYEYIDKAIENLKEFVREYFNNQIKQIDIIFIA